MKEIGGYLSIDKYNLPMLHESAIMLNSGRNCLEYLIINKNIRKLLVPKFLCESVWNVCKKHNVEILYYSINNDFLPDIKNDYSEWIYIVNYYGQLDNNTILNYKSKYRNLIVDNVQSYFQDPCDSVHTIYSCRKFLGVPDGAFLYTDVECNDSIEYDQSRDRMTHLFGSFEIDTSSFYNNYILSEEKFNDLPIKKMSKLTYNLLHGIDYKYVNDSRTNNFLFLHNKLKTNNMLNLKLCKAPYMYPFYIKNGDNVRKKLLLKKIYIPILWKDVFNICDENDLEYDMAKNILPLPIDQRYNIEDMEYLLKEVIECIS